MKLTITHRLGIMAIMPEESDNDGLQMIEDITNKIKLSEDEYKEHILAHNGTTMTVKDADKEMEVELTGKETAFISNSVDAVNSNKKLTNATRSVYTLFCL